MKTCDEMMHSLLERREQYVAAQRKKNRMLAGAAASLCVVALVGVTVWQGGDWLTQPAPIKVADTTTGGTTVMTAPAVTTPTTDGGVGIIVPTTTDTSAVAPSRIEPSGETETSRPTATQAQPTATQSKPTTPTQTEPSKTTATTAPTKLLVTADGPDEYCVAEQDESSLYAMPISPSLQEAMEEYEGTDVVYAVLVAIRYPIRDPRSTPDNPEDDPVYYAAYQEFLKSDKIASLIEEIQVAYDEYIEAENALSDGWYAKKQKYISLKRDFENCRSEFYEEFHIKYSEESLEMLAELSEVEPCHLNRVDPQYPYYSFFDNEYHWAVAMYSWRGRYAYSAVLSADAIRELAEQGRYAFWLDSSESAKDIDIGDIMDTG